MIEAQINKRLLLEKGDKILLPTENGMFSLIPFKDLEGLEHIVLLKGSLYEEDVALTRIHSACATGDLFGSLRCDCGKQLSRSMELIEENQSGIIIYLQQEGRGIGLMNKIKAYKLQEDGMDTVEANEHLGFQPDERDYAIAAQILFDLGVNKVALLTNNPKKISGLEMNGISVVNRVPIEIKENCFNHCYLQTKKIKMNHILSL